MKCITNFVFICRPFESLVVFDLLCEHVSYLCMWIFKYFSQLACQFLNSGTIEPGLARVVEGMHPAVEERANVTIHEPFPHAKPGVHGAMHCEEMDAAELRRERKG